MYDNQTSADTVDMAELIKRLVAGEMIKDLAAKYAISDSSVRLLSR